MDMKKLSTEQLVKDKEISRYSLISGVAKRARAIVGAVCETSDALNVAFPSLR